MSQHGWPLALCLQVMLAFVARIGAGLVCEPATFAACCVYLQVLPATVVRISAGLCRGPTRLGPAMCFQLMLAFVACIGAGLVCQPALFVVYCVLAVDARPCGLHRCWALP